MVRNIRKKRWLKIGKDTTATNLPFWVGGYLRVKPESTCRVSFSVAEHGEKLVDLGTHYICVGDYYELSGIQIRSKVDLSFTYREEFI